MKLNEKQFLVSEKEIEGKDRDSAWNEINNLEKSERAFKILWHEKNALTRKVATLENENKKLRETIFKLKFELDKKPEVKEVNGSLRNFLRLINFMEEDKTYTKTDLARELMMQGKEVEEWLNIFIKYKILNIELNGIYYTRRSITNK